MPIFASASESNTFAIPLLIVFIISPLSESIFFFSNVDDLSGFARGMIFVSATLQPLCCAILLPCFYLYRLHLTFDETTYKLSFANIFCLLLMILISGIFAFVGTISAYEKDRVAMIYFAIAGLFSCIVVFATATLFARKLFALIFTQENRSKTTEVTESDISLQIEIAKKQDTLVHTISKQTLLVCTANGVFLVQNITYLVFIAYFMKVIKVGNNGATYVNCYLGCMSFVLISSSIWLSFTFSQKFYSRICNRCDDEFFKLCHKLTMREAEKRISSIVGKSTTGDYGLMIDDYDADDHDDNDNDPNFDAHDREESKSVAY